MYKTLSYLHYNMMIWRTTNKTSVISYIASYSSYWYKTINYRQLAIVHA